jgi:MFS family permease
VRPTRIVSLVALFVAVAAVVWGALTLVEDRGGVLPPLSWSAPAGLLALGVVVLATALGLRSRLRRGEKRPHPLSMAQMAVLGKASAHVGPIVGGLYGGYALVLLPTLDIGDRGDRALLAGGAVLAALVLTAAGLLLERTCRVRRNIDDDQPSAPA